ncbi:MAG: hypothetical protein ACEPOZ_04810 [Marinifilaceae bacterium]
MKKTLKKFLEQPKWLQFLIILPFNFLLLFGAVFLLYQDTGSKAITWAVIATVLCSLMGTFFPTRYK